MRKKIFSWLVLLVGFLIIFHLGKNLWGLYLANQRVVREGEKLRELATENEALRQKLRYLESEEFVEEEARDKLGLAKEGETMVILRLPSLRQAQGELAQDELLRRDSGEEALRQAQGEAVWREWVGLFGGGEE